MRKAILTFVAALVLILTMLALPLRLQAETLEYPRLQSFLEEGKTWWYMSWVYADDLKMYYSLTLHGDTIQDEKSWKKCYFQVDGKNAVSTPVVLLREEGNIVYITLPKKDEEFIYPELSVEVLDQEKGAYYQDIMDLYHEPGSILKERNEENIFNYDWRKECVDLLFQNYNEMILYDFNESTLQGYFPNLAFLEMSFWWKATGMNTIQNSNHNYLAKYFRCLPNNDLDDLKASYDWKSDDMIVSAIGVFSIAYGGLFFNPYPVQSMLCGGSTHYTKPSCPELLYVTDSNNNIIFEGVGGRKPWEPDGVEYVNDESLSLAVHDGMIRANNNESNKEITLSIYSADGSVVASATGAGKVEYPLTELQKGVYIVKAVAGNSASKTIRVAI